MAMQASEVIKGYQAKNPDKKFAITDSVLGVWIEAEKQYVPFASKVLTGEWYHMPMYVLIDGHKIGRNWIPVGKE
jgi:hypothetical protein